MTLLGPRQSGKSTLVRKLFAHKQKEANNLIPIEIKASKTFNTDFLRGLKYLDKLLPDGVPRGYVIYTGANRAKIDKFNILNYCSYLEIFSN